MHAFRKAARLVSIGTGHRKNSEQAQGARTMLNAVALSSAARVSAGLLVADLPAAEVSSFPFPCLARRPRSVRIHLTSGWPFGSRR